MTLWKKLLLVIVLWCPLVSLADDTKAERAWDKATESAGLAYDAAKDAADNAWIAIKDKSDDAWHWIELRAADWWVVIKEVSDDAWVMVKHNSSELWEESKVLQRNFLMEARITIDKILAPERNLDERHELSSDSDDSNEGNQEA
ncbi:hypothetical protein [Veronia pacifica]|nr:hypothetical protein [Veronia pacifica]